MAAAWASSPEDARAFREDRLLNAKKKYVPKIRAFYQKLEGLRDDLFLEIELDSGNAATRVTYEARPADWFDGIDNKLDGVFVLAPADQDGERFGCIDYPEKVSGVVLVPRGQCSFLEKAQKAQEAGAKSIIVYDEKMSKQPLELQKKTGAVRSKGIATREAGDALTGGVSLLPKERGMTIMGVESGDTKPKLNGAMISRTNGTQLVEILNNGGTPRVLDVKRFSFQDGIDLFIKKDLKKMLNDMEIYSNAMRISKDDMLDPILKTLKEDRDEFEKAVKAKDYAAIRSSFKKWNGHLDPLGQWDLWETF